MATDVGSKKRKASVPDVEPAKLKKSKKVAVDAPDKEMKKRKATEEDASPAVKKSKTPKSTLLEPKPKATKKAPESTNSLIELDVPKKDFPSKKIARKSDFAVEASPESGEEVEAMAAGDGDSDIDDQTEALLKGFESEGDEENSDTEEGLQDGQSVPKIPKLNKAMQKKLKNNESEEKPGIIYVGRIPHGFYESEMKQYFQQFGKILKLRLSRNRQTGASKHYAFVQFEFGNVADIVVKTMDNYLLFGHILKVKRIPDEQVPEGLWKGANKRFKKVPWNKIEGRKLAQGQSEKTWDAKARKVQAERDEKLQKLKEIGYEYAAPKIKSAKGIARPAILANGESEADLQKIESAPAPESQIKPKKESKVTKVQEAIEGIPSAEQARSSERKGKKRVSKETVEEAIEVPETKLKTNKSETLLVDKASILEGSAKTKKAKKTKATA